MSPDPRPTVRLPVPAPSKARQLPVETLKRFLTPPEEGKEQVKKPWHTLEAEAVTALMRTDPADGLSAAAAGERLKEYGPNLLPKPEARSGARNLL